MAELLLVLLKYPGREVGTLQEAAEVSGSEE